MKKLTNAIVALFLLCTTAGFAQITVNDNVTDATMGTTLAGNGVTVSNVSVTCSSGAYGTFDASASNVGINTGIALSTGMLNGGGCVYTLELSDANMNGWGCGEMHVTINGTLYGIFSDQSAFGMTSYAIPIEDGDLLELTYVKNGSSGCGENQNSYILYDDGFATLSSGGVPITQGLIYSSTVNCSGGSSLFGLQGPNDINTAAFAFGTTITDPDIMALEPLANKDVCMMEFDVVPTCNVLNMNYVFASEEYHDYVCSDYNDAFGFFISGPGIAGPFTNGAENIAVVPGSSDYVAINTINRGSKGTFGTNSGCGGAGNPGLNNSAYFNNNGNSNNCPGPGFCTDNTIIRYNGMTVPLTASMTVTPCQTYHMKVIIADANDHSFDSGVFLTYEGLNCPNTDVQINPLITNMAEGCQDGSFEMVRNGDISGPLSITLTGTGTAGAGDYSVTNVVNMAGGQANTTVTVNALTDALVEGTENVTITATWPICQGNATATVDLTIADGMALTVNETAHESCGGACDGAISTTLIGGVGPFVYVWDSGETTTGVTGLCNGGHDLTITDNNGCVTTGTGNITVGAGVTADINVTSNATQCLAGNSFDYDGSVSASGITGYSWNYGDLNTGSGVNVAHSYASAGTYTIGLTVTDGSCSDQTTAMVTVTNPPTVSLTTPNPSCTLPGTITATGNGGAGTYNYAWSGGLPAGSGASQTVSNIANAVYTVTVTDAAGCEGTDVLAIAQPANMTLTQTCNNTSTAGGSDGSTSVSVSGGTTAYSYNWSNIGAGTNAQSSLTASTYTVTVTDGNGCTATSSCAVNDPGCAVTSSVTTTDVTCNSGNDGTVFVSASGGLAPYAYVWSSVLAGSTNMAVSMGTYDVTITDGSGCTATNQAVVDEPTSLSVAVACTGETANGANDGSATSTVSGGITAYNYSWSNGTTLTSVNGLTPGTITLTLTDNNGCVAIDNCTVTAALCALSLTTNATSAACFGGTGTASATPSGGAGYSYLWTAGETTASISGLMGNYSVTVTDGNGCTITGQSTITEPAALNVAISCVGETSNGANDGSSSSSVSGGTTNYAYSWSNGTTLASANGLAPGGVSLTVTDANGCSVTDACTVTAVNCGLSVLISVTDAACFGGNGALFATANGGTGYTYVWSNGATTSTVTGAVVGVHDLTVTDANGCEVVDQVELFEPSAVSLSWSQTNIGCNGEADGDATVAASGGTTPYVYLWSEGSTTNAIGGLSAGGYTLSITDANGCESQVSGIISEPTAMNITATPTNPSCNGLADGSVQTAINGGMSGYTYIWSNSITNTNITSLLADVYSVTATDVNGCTVTETVTLTDPEGIGVSVTSIASNCGAADGSVAVLLTGGNQPYSYDWGSGPTTISTVTGLLAGTYQLTVSDASICSTTIIYGILDASGPTVTILAESDVSCYGMADGVLNIQVDALNPPLTYLWSTGATTAAAGGLTAGNYTVSVTDANGCLSTVVGSVNSPSQVTITSTTVPEDCDQDNGSATITVAGGVSDYIYAWGTNVTESFENSAASLGQGSYEVYVTDATGCITSATVEVGMVDQVTANFDVSLGSDLPSSTATFTNQSANASVYAWVFGDGTTGGDEHPVHEYGLPYTYEVILIAYSGIDSTCSDTISRTVEVTGASSLELPNVFTPNGDGSNDVFNAMAVEIESLSGMIFNRWGEKIWAWQTVQGGWDGRTLAGEQAPDGVYFVKVKATGKDGETYDLQGVVTMIR